MAVLSHGYWRRRFGATCSVVGQTLNVRGVPFTIVGVTAAGFAGVENAKATDLWVPLQNRVDLNAWGMRGQAPLYAARNWWCIMMMGRLAPGISEKEAVARMNPVFQRAAYATLRSPRQNEKRPNLFFRSARGIAGMRESAAEPLKVLMAMVGLVLVIACANVAMLLVARNAARRREFSIRMAIGGSRLRLFRQLLTESLVLVAAGAVGAWMFAVVATQALAAWSDLSVDLTPDRTVLLFTLGISIAGALVFGLAPVRSAVRVPIGLALRTSSGTAGQDRGSLRGRKIVIALQVSLCLTLLMGAGLLVRSLSNLQNINLGMRTAGLLIFGINPQQVRSDAQAIRFYDALVARLRGLPGVESVTLMQNRIGAGWSNNTGAVVNGKNPLGNKFAPMRWNAVGGGYFSTLGTPLRHGRDFDDADNESGPKVAIVNETFAARYLPNQNPLGHHVAMYAGKDAPQYAIIGVASNSKYTGVREQDPPLAYFPYKQVPGISAMHVELRTAGNPLARLPEVRRAVREIAPDVPLMRPVTQQQQFESTFSDARLFARLGLFFGLLAALLVATGLYGTLSYSVSRRTSEVGIRMALGAQRGQVLWMVLRESLIVCLAGLVVGSPLAILCSRLMRSMLFGVLPGDPATFVGAFAGIVVVALLASVLPARRAASVHPTTALRYE